MEYFGYKRGLVDSYLPWLLIALAVLAIVMITISLLKSEGSGLIGDLKDMFEFLVPFVLVTKFDKMLKQWHP